MEAVQIHKFDNIAETGAKKAICAFFPSSQCWFMIYWQDGQWVAWNYSGSRTNPVDIDFDRPSHFMFVHDFDPTR